MPDSVLHPVALHDPTADDAHALLDGAKSSWTRCVPHCPGWDIAELVRHTGGILAWMAAIVTTRERVARRTLDPAPEDPIDLPSWYTSHLDQTVTSLAGIGTAVALFPVVKRQSEALALGFVTTRMFEAAVIIIGVVSPLAVVTLRHPGATGAEANSLVIAGQSLVAVRNWTFLLGPNVMAGLNARGRRLSGPSDEFDLDLGPQGKPCHRHRGAGERGRARRRSLSVKVSHTGRTASAIGSACGPPGDVPGLIWAAFTYFCGSVEGTVRRC